jgi:hypothetical protein
MRRLLLQHTAEAWVENQDILFGVAMNSVALREFAPPILQVSLVTEQVKSVP